MADAADRMLVGAADRFYLQRDWAAALPMYRAVHARNPALSAELALALSIGHCAVETDDPAPLPALSATGGPRESVMLNDLRTRAYEICRDGAFGRAVRLLRFIAAICPMVGGVYRDGFLAGPTARCAAFLAGGDGSDPAFLADVVPAATIAALKQRHAGTRMLLVARRFHYNNPLRIHEPVDYVGRTARKFGLVVQEFNSHWVPGGEPPELYPALLLDAITSFKPDLIWYDDLFQTGISVSSPELADQIATVLQMARRSLGARVVKGYPDAWMVEPQDVTRGLGESVDLIYHCHPAILARASDVERAHSFCWPWPHELATPTVERASVPRVSFVGSIYSFNYGRMAWWAEAMERGLPIDFKPWLPSDWQGADPHGSVQQSDTDYVNALVGHRMALNLTRRSTGTKILTGRSIETPMAGGVLLEEDSFDAAYFLKPGEHYVPFQTLDDLANAIGALLDDAPRRDRIGAAGRDWTMRYFSGEHYWAGLLARLYA